MWTNQEAYAFQVLVDQDALVVAGTSFVAYLYWKKYRLAEIHTLRRLKPYPLAVAEVLAFYASLAEALVVLE